VPAFEADGSDTHQKQVKGSGMSIFHN